MSEIAPPWSEMVSLPSILPSEVVAGRLSARTIADAEHPGEATSLINQAETTCLGKAVMSGMVTTSTTST